MASAIWQKSFQDNPFSREAGVKYREECLSHGGGKPSHLLVGDHLECQLSPPQLADALIHEIDTKQRQLQEALKA